VETKRDGAPLLALDVGGTFTRAVLLGGGGELLARFSRRTATLHPEPGAVEHDPEEVWGCVRGVIGEALDWLASHRPAAEAGRPAQGQVNQAQPAPAQQPAQGRPAQGQAAQGQQAAQAQPAPAQQPAQGQPAPAALGLCVQRATFCLWRREDGALLTNLISWADVRAAEEARRMNRTPHWILLRALAGLASRITGSAFLTATSQLRFVTDHIFPRLLYLFRRRPELLDAARRGEIAFGTLDTFLLHRLTGGEIHATDASNAAATSMYNPFTLKWNRLFCRFFHVPMSILPGVRDTAADYGRTAAELFGGAEIPIRAVAGDQMAALFGHACFRRGEVKVSQGSGSFVDINVGGKGVCSRRGLFPLVAWRIDGRATYMLEGSVATAGKLIDWLGEGIGLSDTPAVLNDYAAQCEDTDGVIFVPTPAGIRFPYFNPRAKGTILGLSLTTHKRHVARAVLEGIAHRIVDILEGIRADTGIPVVRVKVDGGVSQSDILLQMIADFSGYEVERSSEVEMSARGTGLLAGLGAGIWSSTEELRELTGEYTRFEPRSNAEERRRAARRWHRAVKAVLKVYGN
jgi:glycerol kinase